MGEVKTGSHQDPEDPKVGWEVAPHALHQGVMQEEEEDQVWRCVCQEEGVKPVNNLHEKGFFTSRESSPTGSAS